MQKATLSVVNVPAPKSPFNYAQNTQIALDNESEFGLSQRPTFGYGFYSILLMFLHAKNPLCSIYHLISGVKPLYSECALINCLHVE